MKSKLLLSLLTFIGINAIAQQMHCGYDEMRTTQVSAEPQLKQQEDAINKLIYSKAVAKTKDSKSNRTVYYVPMVVHITHYNGPENISDSLVIAGINELNLRFQNAAPYYDSTGHVVDIQFCLATIDPQGNATTGITRDYNSLTYLNVGSEIQLKDLSRWDPLRYYNVWVVNVIGGFGQSVGGYSSFPSNIGTPTDGVVIIYSSITNSNLLAHESGHYLGLYHTFQNGCTNYNSLLDGDCVSDTPPDVSNTFECRDNSCSTEMNDTSGFNPFTGDVDNLPNYMDYTNCPLSFTQGQADRMNSALANVRYQLLQSNGCGFAGGPLPVANFSYTLSSCYEGIVSFNDSLSTNVTTINWDFDNDGVWDAFGHNPTFTYPSTGYYTTKLLVTGPGGVDTVSHTFLVRKGSSPFYPIIMPTSGGVYQYPAGVWRTCSNNQNNFTAPPNAQSYLWSTGDTTQSIYILPTASYNLTLTMVDSMGLTWTNAVCAPLFVNVIQAPAHPHIYSNDPLVICNGDSATFNCSNMDTLSGNTYTWWMTSQAQPNINDTSLTVIGTGTNMSIVLLVESTNSCSNVSNLIFLDSYAPPAVQTVTQTGLQLSCLWGLGNQWYKDGVPIPGATSSTYTVTQNGCYSDACFFSFLPGCYTMTDTFCYVSVGLNQYANPSDGINIYPVPSSDNITLQCSSELMGAGYKITDPIGKEVMKGILKSETNIISLSELANGIYLFEMMVNQTPIVRKIVKE